MPWPCAVHHLCCRPFPDHRKAPPRSPGLCRWPSSLPVIQCQWEPKAVPGIEAVRVSELRINLDKADDECQSDDETVQGIIAMPSAAAFIEAVKKHQPDACMLDAYERLPQKAQVIEEMPVMTPQSKLDIFLSCHTCNIDGFCDNTCFEELSLFMRYSEEENAPIESTTRGQASNANWHIMRENLLTPSSFKTICHSTNGTKTAVALFNGPTFDQSNPPVHIRFGQRFEAVARDQFMKAHKYNHQSCKVNIPCLCMNTEYPFLAASPDGVLSCKEGPQALVEIKCLSSKRNFNSSLALVRADICKRQDGALVMNTKHQYYYQVQGQMALTGIHQCHLVGFTNKGIAVVTVNFDPLFWEIIHKKLTNFLCTAHLPMLTATYVNQRPVGL